MLDFIKVSVKTEDYLKTMIDNPNLNFKQAWDIKEECLTYPIWGYWNNVKIKINPKTIVMWGSLHKLYNIVMEEENQNYSDFSFEQLQECLDIFSEALQINLEDAEIQNLEVGVNIKLDRGVRKFIENNLVHMKYRQPKIETFNKDAVYREFQFSHFRMKVYDKGGQFRLDEDLLRVEFKAIKSQVFKNCVTSLEALRYRENFYCLKELLMTRVNQLTIIEDFVDREDISNDDKLKLNHYWNPKVWNNLKEHQSDYKFRKAKSEFKVLIEKYRLDDFKTNLAMKVSKKCDELLFSNQRLAA